MQGTTVIARLYTRAEVPSGGCGQLIEGARHTTHLRTCPPCGRRRERRKTSHCLCGHRSQSGKREIGMLRGLWRWLGASGANSGDTQVWEATVCLRVLVFCPASLWPGLGPGLGLVSCSGSRGGSHGTPQASISCRRSFAWAWVWVRLCLVLGCRGVGGICVFLCAWMCQEGMRCLSAVCRDVSVCPTLNWSHF